MHEIVLEISLETLFSYGKLENGGQIHFQNFLLRKSQICS